MRTIPLSGSKAAGRVALVDDEDYELVSRYRWRVYERAASARYPAAGPYAVTSIVRGDTHGSLQMHRLIMGVDVVGDIDHKNHNGLDNRRHNLRPATRSQNSQNQRPQVGRSSQYKGVFWCKQVGLWRAIIRYDNKQHRLGDFVNELEAAYAYDAAARKSFGEFACPNFPGEPAQAMRDEWREETDARSARLAALNLQRMGVLNAGLWDGRRYRTEVCTVCGEEYQTRALQESIYCSNKCNLRAFRRRRREEREAARGAIGA